MFLRSILVLFLCLPVRGEEPQSIAAKDEAQKKAYRSKSEFDLRADLVALGSEAIKNLDEPENYVKKAFVAEVLTKWDAKRGTNHWNRAAYHYWQGIQKWEAIAKDEKNPRYKEAPHRLALLHLYRANCLIKDKKRTEALDELRQSEKDPALKDAVAAARTEAEKIQNEKQ